MPTLNEEEGIAECIDRIKNALVDIGVYGEIIVSDDSTDRTPEIAREMGAIVVNPDGKGYGYAYQYAFEHARGEFIAIGDADCTYDFEELPKLYDLVANGDADMAMGSRLEGKILPGSMPKLHQYVGNPLLTKFLNVFYGAGVSDAHSGMRVFTQDALATMDCETTGMEFASEMIMEAGARGLTIEEVPITYHARAGEAKLDSFRDGWRHVKFMLENAPGYLFSVPGFVLGTFGLLLMGLAFFHVSLGGFTPGAHSMMAGSLLTLVGYQIASMGVFATITTNPIRKPEDRVTTWITNNLRLEQGATLGTIIFGAGAAYGAVLFGQWASSGFSQLPLLMADVVALTAVVLGIQIVFGSFFLSAIAE
ncbi:glycosyltransferase family 2 protein [Halomarina salina]|uniref:Glycosyltransferase family 2 protein n=1 Tax=Halomarina salina TaxID=1872699 RepID=A0ABD5RSA5_9EURY|nr:glycosyltransferase family 2 protein [Halomarina salina]